MSSSINENVVLNIKRGQGLSQAIDEKLDSELNRNVQLKFSEWQSVFNLVKEGQVSENKSQFGEKDKDIRNGRHYIVGQGAYQLTQDVWNKILKIAKNSLGITEEQIQEAPAADADVQTQTVDTPSANGKEEHPTRQIVTQMLQNAGINIEELDIDDISKKYEAIKTANPDIEDEKISERISNYAKALKMHQKETNFANAWKYGSPVNEAIEISGVAQAIEGGNIDEFKSAFHKAAKEYIELYDNAQGDGKIDVDELLAIEEKELGKKLTEEERKIVLSEAINRVAILDANSDNVLDEAEIAAYLWAMSKINDGKTGKTADNITFDEWKTSQNAMNVLSGYEMTEVENSMVNYALQVSNKMGIPIEKLYAMDDYSSLTSLKTEEQVMLKAGMNVLKSKVSVDDITNYLKFNAALKTGYENLK